VVGSQLGKNLFGWNTWPRIVQGGLDLATEGFVQNMFLAIEGADGCTQDVGG